MLAVPVVLVKRAIDEAALGGQIASTRSAAEELGADGCRSVPCKAVIDEGRVGVCVLNAFDSAS